MKRRPIARLRGTIAVDEVRIDGPDRIVSLPMIPAMIWLIGPKRW